ncbi:hypothetical protein C8F01DRAFT_1102144 [Mycena amicta]|nr:hypothetical protein C8F01DRAFT_1102144 [Mycena amicta]
MTASTLDLEEHLRDGQTVLYYAATLILQTFCLGGYTVLIVFSTRVLLRTGQMRAQATKTLFWLGLFMYALSTAYWLYSIVDFVARMQFFIDPKNPQYAEFFNQVTTPFNLFNALVLVNFSITDGIVVWRASVICPRNRLHRRLLWVPMLLLVLTVAFASTLILLRFIGIFSKELTREHFFAPLVDMLQFSSVMTSLFSNLTATGLIGSTAWRHRQRIKYAFHERSKAEQALKLLLESGLLYCAATLFVVLALFIRLPHGTLGDIYLPVTIQFAGAYAPAMLLLILNNRTSQTEFLGTDPSHSREPIRFAAIGATSGSASELGFMEEKVVSV